VLKELGQHQAQMVLVNDQQPVEEFAAQGARRAATPGSP
jgi:hypothetical protein